MHPADVGPAAHQPATPFGPDEAAHARRGIGREAAEGVAVEIDDAVVDVEPLAKARQRIRTVELLTECAIDDLRQRDGHSRLRTSHRSGKKRCSMVRRRYSTPRLPPVPGRVPVSRAAINVW